MKVKKVIVWILAIKGKRKKEGIMREISKKSSQYVVLAILGLSLVSCSTSNIANRGEYIDRKCILKGTPRIDLLVRFGGPIETKVNDDGKKVDMFRIEQGESTSGKVLKGTGSLILAVGTWGISEIVAHPVTKKTPMVIFEVTYDENEQVDTVKFIQLPK